MPLSLGLDKRKCQNTRLNWSINWCSSFQSTPRKRNLLPTILSLLAFLFAFPPTVIAQSTGDTFRGLPIRPENRCSPYRSSDYPYSQSVEPEISDYQGGFFSPYSMRCFVSIRQADIEHIVARSEAHDSGLCAATAQVRREFAEDLLNLTHAAPRLNRREKIAKDASEWLPPNNRCWYAHTIVEVKRKYGLTIDQEEAAALSEILRNCPEVGMELPTCVGKMPFITVPAPQDTFCIPVASEEYFKIITGKERVTTNQSTVLGWVGEDEHPNTTNPTQSTTDWSIFCE